VVRRDGENIVIDVGDLVEIINTPFDKENLFGFVNGNMGIVLDLAGYLTKDVQIFVVYIFDGGRMVHIASYNLKKMENKKC
tara:strand:- start:1421 stop:1663 length:243 start_codon:yes stop_codon:yes gene_type:complete